MDDLDQTAELLRAARAAAGADARLIVDAGLSYDTAGAVVVVDSPEEAVELSDWFAPEHLELHIEDPDWYLDRLRAYGAAFIGPEATVTFGDKASGPNHTQPTQRAARFTADAAAKVAAPAAAISHAESRAGHALAAEARLAP